MKDIFNLMKLDLICIKKNTLLPMLYITAAFLAIGFFIFPNFMMQVIVFPPYIVSSVFLTAEKYGFNRLYGILPIKRSSVVYARFALGVLSVAAAAAVMLPIGFAADRAALFEQVNAGFAETYYMMKSDGFGIVFFCALVVFEGCLFTGIMYSMMFILGAERQSIVMIVTFVIVGITFIGVAYISPKIIFMGYSKAAYCAILCLSGILFNVIMSVITAAVIQRREL